MFVVVLANNFIPFFLWDIGIEWANVEYIYSSDDCVVWKWRLFSTKWTKSVVSLMYDFCFLSIGCMSESMKLEMRSVGPPLPETFGRPAKFGLWIWVRVDFNVLSHLKVVSSLLHHLCYRSKEYTRYHDNFHLCTLSLWFYFSVSLSAHVEFRTIRSPSYS